MPREYAETIAKQSKEAHVFSILGGEESKSLNTYEMLLSKMLYLGFSRSDCVVAVGGGVVGDLSGFVAASYMRGIDFYNIPTTVLSQIDSSIGGKVAVNLCGIKNIVGAFYQPKKVLIDPDVLSTLDARQVSNGLSESVKMALTFDSDLFELFEREDPEKFLEDIICRSIELKIAVVEQDEKENGLRRVLNFGHTVGHGIESLGLGYYHGECVALGMLPMCTDKVRERLIPVLKKLGLPTSAEYDIDLCLDAVSHDKKAINDGISVVVVNEVGSFEITKMTVAEIKNKIQ